MSAEELAALTTDECFKSADLDKDGRLSFDEFKKWYSTSDNGADADANGDVEEIEAEDWLSLDLARQLTRLGFHSPRGGLRDPRAICRSKRRAFGNAVRPRILAAHW